MAKRQQEQFGAGFRTVGLADHFNWPPRSVRGEWWRELAARVRDYPRGEQRAWGIPFQMGDGRQKRVILSARGRPEVTVPVRGRADFLCVLHEWRQLPGEVNWPDPTEGLAVAEYEVAYADGGAHVQPVRGRFEVAMQESPGPPWLAVPFNMWHSVDPVNVPKATDWAYAQTGTTGTGGAPLVYALPNPRPDRPLKALTIRGLVKSPLIVAGLTLYRGASHPLRHLPRRSYRVHVPGQAPEVEEAEVDLGGVTRLERTRGPCGERWLNSDYAGLARADEPPRRPETLVEAFGAEDATVSVTLKGMILAQEVRRCKC